MSKDQVLEINLLEAEVAPTKEKKGKAKKESAIPEGHVTANELAAEFGMSGRDLRVILRGMFPDHEKGARWSWHKDSSELASIKAAIKAKRDALAEKKAASKKEKAANVEVDVVEEDDDNLIVIE